MSDALFMTIFSGLWGLLILFFTGVSRRIMHTIDDLSRAVAKLTTDVALINQKMEMQHV